MPRRSGRPGVQMNTPTLPGDTHWEEKDVRALVAGAKKHGLKFEAIENVPIHFYDKAMLGLPGRDEQIENYQTTIRNWAAPASRSSATTSCPTRSGAPTARRRPAAAQVARSSTWPRSSGVHATSPR